MKNKKKIISAVIALLLVIAVAVGVIAMKPEKAEETETSYFMLTSDDKIYLVNTDDENPKPIFIDEKNSETWIDAKPAISADGERVVYSVNNRKADYGNTSEIFDLRPEIYDLYMYNIQTEEKALIAEDILSYAADRDLTEFAYLKNPTYELYRRSEGAEEKIFDNVALYYMTEDGEKIVFETRDEKLYVALKGQAPELIGENMTVADFDVTTGGFIYKSGDEIARYENGNVTVITEKSGGMIRHNLGVGFKNGYFDVNQQIVTKADYFEDDLDIADIDITEKEKKAVRKMVKELTEAEWPYNTELYDLRYFDGENMTITGVTSRVEFETGVGSNADNDNSLAVYKQKGEISKIKLSDVYGKSEDELIDMYYEAVDATRKYVVLKDGKVIGELDMSLICYYYDAVSETMYLVEGTGVAFDDAYGYKNIKKVSLANGKLGEIKAVDEDIVDDTYILADGEFYYTKIDGEKTNLCKNGEIVLENIERELVDYYGRTFVNDKGESVAIFEDTEAEHIALELDPDGVNKVANGCFVLSKADKIIVYKSAEDYKVIDIENGKVDTLKPYELNRAGVSTSM